MLGAAAAAPDPINPIEIARRATHTATTDAGRTLDTARTASAGAVGQVRSTVGITRFLRCDETRLGKDGSR